MKGWRCPGCSRCYSPRVQECATCRPSQRNPVTKGFADECARMYTSALAGIQSTAARIVADRHGGATRCICSLNSTWSICPVHGGP